MAEYKPVPIEENDDESQPQPILPPPRPRSPARRNLLVIFLSISNIVFIALSAVLYARSQTDTSGDTVSCADGFDTDFPDARQAIKYEERRFTGALRWNGSSRRLYRDIDPQEPQYFGEPSEKIDQAWKQLLYGEFVAMTDEEAQPFKPELPRMRRTGFHHMELDVMHSFHCINALRTHIDGDYYKSHNTIWSHNDLGILQEDWVRIHMDHCLDQLFQSVRCFGDLSPVPLYSYQGAPVALGIGDVHTCRKFDPIRKWYDDRNEQRKPINEFFERPEHHLGHDDDDNK